MRMVTTDGDIHCFQVDMAQFGELRYSVALALHEMKRLRNDDGIKRVEELQKEMMDVNLNKK